MPSDAGDGAADLPEPPRKAGKRIEIGLKRLLDRVLRRVLRATADGSLDDVRDVRRVLLVRPNFRIGNTLLATPLVAALHRRFPAASIDVLAGDVTAALLEQLPLDRVHTVSRGFLARPWRFVALFCELRRCSYDVAVDGGMSSFSGGLYAYLTGARHRIGHRGAADPFLTVRLPVPARTGHVCDRFAAFARQLGDPSADRPLYAVSSHEAREAEARLAELLAGQVWHGAFVALFVGGHMDKRWPVERWLALVDELVACGCPLLVFVGPEERDLVPRFAEHAPGVVVPPGGLRAFAALLARATLVVTPDSGALHLSVALGRPTVALLQRERSLRFRPRGPDDLVLLRPDVADVLAALRTHRAWPTLVREHAHPERLPRPDVIGSTELRSE